MPFYHDRKEIFNAIYIMRREKCCYDSSFALNGIDGIEPSTCDCKYGYPGQKINGIGEQTGCPELRCVEDLLKNITDKEYEKIMYRSMRKYLKKRQKEKKI